MHAGIILLYICTINEDHAMYGDIVLHMCTINNNKLYDVRFLRYGVQWTDFLVILEHFLLFYLPNNPENQNFEE